MELENYEQSVQKVNELQRKITDIEVTLQVPGLPEEFIASSLEKIKKYRTELTNMNY